MPNELSLHGGEFPTPTCEWFLLCGNPAVGTRKHPIIGDVPICARCNEKCDALEAD